MNVFTEGQSEAMSYELVYDSNRPAKEQAIIPLEEIFDDNDFNCRESISVESIAELAESIRDHGLLLPLLVQPIKHSDPKYKYRIIAGYRRFNAVKYLGHETVECTIRHNLTADQSIIVNYTENKERLDLNIMEEAMIVKKLLGMGYLDIDIRDKLNVTYDWLRTRLAALSLPEPVQQMVANRELTQNQIRDLGWSITKGKEGGYETKDAVIKAAAQMRDRKNRVEKSFVKPDVLTPEVKEAKAVAENKDKFRNITDIYRMQEELIKVLDTNIGSRALAWAINTITTTDFLGDLKREASFLGIEYVPNEELRGL